MKTAQRFRSRTHLRQRGINLVELMITLLLAGVIVAAAIVLTVHYSQNNAQQERLIDLQNNLRMASQHVALRLRRSGYAVPESLRAWLPATWPDLAVSPAVIQGAGVAADELIMVSCSTRPQAVLSAPLAANSTSLVLTSAVPGKSISDLFDNSGRKLLRLMAGSDGTRGFASVVSVSGSTLTIDTDPDTSGNQGFAARSYFAGTPVCRLDITHYRVDSSKKTLQVNEYQGAGWQDVFDGIVDFQVAGTGPTYTITLTGRTDEASPVQRSQALSVTIRNP